MESPLSDCYEDYYYYLEDYEEDTGPPSEQGAAVSAGGTASHDHQSQDNSENQQGKLKNDQVPDKDLHPEGDQREQEPMETDQEEPAFPLAAVPKHQGTRHRIQFGFTHWQVREMETLFQETENSDVLTREELARRMNVPEAKVRMWFNNRRAKQRAREKKALLRTTPGGIQDHICLTDPEEP